jgi:hypothetical protein
MFLSLFHATHSSDSSMGNMAARLTLTRVRSGINAALIGVAMATLAAAGSAIAATCPVNLGARETPTAAFTVNANGTVTHATTGLTWAQCTDGLSGSACTTGSANLYQQWVGALAAAKDSNFAGFTDWRLPSKRELESIIDRSCFSPTANDAVFPNVAVEHWTSTTDVSFPAQAWVVSFYDGTTTSASKGDYYAVRLVRGGQAFDRLASCNLDLNGDGMTTADKDGVLLLRYLLGFRGAALIAGVPIAPVRGNATDVASFIGLVGKYDVFGRPAPTAVAALDGLVLTRLMLLVSDSALLNGVTVPPGSTYGNAADVRNAVNLKCGTSF